MTFAITRVPAADLAACELTFLERQPIDAARAFVQHSAYQDTLRDLGLDVVTLPELDGLPDAVFVEDTAIVVDEVAVVTRPGAPSRAAEAHETALALAAHRELRWITPPATIDGGDVLRVGRTLYVGLSRRTSADSLRQLENILGPFGYRIVGVPVTHCLHLKSAATYAGDDTLVVYLPWVDAAAFDGFHGRIVEAIEPAGGNVLPVKNTLLVAANAPHTEERLLERGFRTRAVDIGELQKAEAALTCMSLIVS